MHGADKDRTSINEAMAAFGLEPEFEEQKDFELWPDNERIMCAFGYLVTEWNMGPGGPISLKIESIVSVFKLLAINRDEWRNLINDLRHVEAEALKILYEEKP